MGYSDIYLNRQEKPPWLMLVFAGLSIFGFSFLILGNKNTISTRASNEKLIRQEIVNLTPMQAGIFWQSAKAESGWIMYGENKTNLNNMAKEENTINSNNINHYVLLKDLDPEKIYYYKIFSKEKVYSISDKESFSFKTPKNIKIQSSIIPAYGTLIRSNGKPAENIYLILNVKDKIPLLTITKSKGEFMLPLNQLVEKKDLLLLPADNDEEVMIEFLENNNKSYLKAYIKQINPLTQSTIFGKDYDLTQITDVLGDSIGLNKKVIEEENIRIVYPKENAIVPASKPLIKGFAFPNKEVIVTINLPKELTMNTLSDQNGEWKVLPNLLLPSGEYMMLATSFDLKGKKIEAKRQFIIAKSGEQVMGEATAEPTLTITPIRPSPTYSPIMTTTPVPPNTGYDINSWLILSGSLVVAGLGILLVF